MIRPSNYFELHQIIYLNCDIEFIKLESRIKRIEKQINRNYSIEFFNQGKCQTAN